MKEEELSSNSIGLLYVHRGPGPSNLTGTEPSTLPGPARVRTPTLLDDRQHSTPKILT